MLEHWDHPVNVVVITGMDSSVDNLLQTIVTSYK